MSGDASGEDVEEVRVEKITVGGAGRHLSFYTVVACHCLAFLRDLHSNLVVIAVFFVEMAVSPLATMRLDLSVPLLECLTGKCEPFFERAVPISPNAW
jgi:hypothetical protein